MGRNENFGTKNYMEMTSMKSFEKQEFMSLNKNFGNKKIHGNDF